MALYTVFYLTAFHWLEVNVTVPAIWVHCQLDDVIPFCKYAIVPYFAWFAWIPFTLFYLLLRGDRSDFWRVCLCLFTGMTIALSCYCLLYTSDAADEEASVDLGGPRIIKKKKDEHRSRQSR